VRVVQHEEHPANRGHRVYARGSPAMPRGERAEEGEQRRKPRGTPRAGPHTSTPPPIENIGKYRFRVVEYPHEPRR